MAGSALARFIKEQLAATGIARDHAKNGISHPVGDALDSIMQESRNVLGREPREAGHTSFGPSLGENLTDQFAMLVVIDEL